MAKPKICQIDSAGLAIVKSRHTTTFHRNLPIIRIKIIIIIRTMNAANASDPFQDETPFIPSLVLPLVNASVIAVCRVSLNIILN